MEEAQLGRNSQGLTWTGRALPKDEGDKEHNVPDGDKWEFTKQDIPYRALNKIEHPMFFT